MGLLDSILESTHDAVLVLDLDLRIVRYNSRFLEMFRLTPADLEPGGASMLADRIGPQLEDPAQMAPTPDEAWHKSPFELIDVLRFKDGRVYHRHVVPHYVNGRLAGRVASYRDITHRIFAQKTFEEHQAFLEKAQEVAHLGSWVAEQDGSDRVVWSNEIYRIFGVNPVGSTATSKMFMSFVHADDLEIVQRAIGDALAGRKVYEIEHRIVRRDGTIRWVHERGDVIRSADGSPVRMVGICQDITERRQLEEELRQSQKLEAIGRLAGGVAHDLNNALTAIAGYTDLALSSLADDHPAKQDVEEIRRAAERAEAVTRQLLAFSRKQMLQPRVFSLATVVADLGRLIERLLGANIDVRTDVHEHLPLVYGDPGQIEQAVINLAVNARDAMTNGGRLTLSVTEMTADEAFARTHQPMTPGKYVVLAVADTGHGMSAETQAHIFEPFFTTKPPGKGTGLGLAMVYGTIRQSGGHIFVESTIGAGTTFSLYFPAAANAPAAVEHAGQRGTILVAEDETAIRTLVVNALTQSGYRVLSAASGDAALTLARGEPEIDLLLTDARMPGMSGGELATQLAAARPGIRVMMMSGYTDETVRVDGSLMLKKPFTPRELRQKVESILNPT
jgi:PAS domain S-box-containing protein